MHLSIMEQLSIDQPTGISDLYKQLCNKTNNKHNAEHEVMDCMAEMIWQSQYTQNQLDPTIYLNCISAKLVR